MNEKLVKRLIGAASENDFFKNQVLWNSGGVIFHKEDMIRLIDLVVKECMADIERCGTRSGDTEHNRALNSAWYKIKDHFYGEKNEFKSDR